MTLKDVFSTRKELSVRELMDLILFVGGVKKSHYRLILSYDSVYGNYLRLLHLETGVIQNHLYPLKDVYTQEDLPGLLDMKINTRKWGHLMWILDNEG